MMVVETRDMSDGVEQADGPPLGEGLYAGEASGPRENMRWPREAREDKGWEV
jgi:hypothetical protein